MSKLFIGVMSGTSLDGVDITLCKIDSKKCKLLASLEYPFDKGLKKEILYIISNKTALLQIGSLNNKLGKLFASAINELIKQNSIEIKDIEAIGLHGQTLWHHPTGNNPFTIQLGCPSVVSARTGIKVVSDFRSMDVANGGQGAPFAPAFHKFVFSHLKNVAVVNIGGMSNITLLGKELRGWDCGPGNVLMDLWISKCKKLPYDKKGKFASSGRSNQLLLDSMMSDSFFHKEPPKSTGREKFNKKYLESHLENFKELKPRDIQRTLLELTAKTITKDVKDNSVKKLIICGGGSKNRTLMKRLEKLTSMDVKPSDDYGVSSDYLESMAFAWLAYKRLRGEVVELSSVTGSYKDSILGGIYG